MPVYAGELSRNDDQKIFNPDYSNTNNEFTSPGLDSEYGVIKSKENGHNLVLKQTQNKDVKVNNKIKIFEEEPDEKSVLQKSYETSDPVADEKCLTLTGTIKRGKKAGQNLDVKINISREELEVLDATMSTKNQQSCLSCGLQKGPHIVLWSLLCFPFVTIMSSVYSFYIGTLMWYNIFTYVTEEVNIFWRIPLSPVLILLYPFFILISSLGLGLYGGVIQISWFLDNWSKEVSDWEKGFYGWLCSFLCLSDCSPYEVVILSDVQQMSVESVQDCLSIKE